MLLTSASGYAMLVSGVAKRTLRLEVRGRCRRCGRLRGLHLPLTGSGTSRTFCLHAASHAAPDFTSVETSPCS